VGDIPLSTTDDGFLLVAARQLAYRRVELEDEVATATGRQLIVVGDGPERRSLERRAGATVTFEGFVPRARLIQLVTRCSAYIVPGEEDFGIAPVEAMAAGKPVVAINRGGTAETVIDSQTGVLFDEQSVAGLTAALDRLDGMTFDHAAIREHANTFDREAFRQTFGGLLVRLGADASLIAF
jgi:glycosyltransferase involved in cell wall biosynthesis